MDHYRAPLFWRRAADTSFNDNRYSRRHRQHFDGGAELAASSSPQVVRLPVSAATAVDPEEMIVAALASCRRLWFLSLAAVDRPQLRIGPAGQRRLRPARTPPSA